MYTYCTAALPHLKTHFTACLQHTILFLLALTAQLSTFNSLALPQ
jgi:hypothetical protein